MHRILKQSSSFEHQELHCHNAVMMAQRISHQFLIKRKFRRVGSKTARVQFLVTSIRKYFEIIHRWKTTLGLYPLRITLEDYLWADTAEKYTSLLTTFRRFRVEISKKIYWNLISHSCKNQSENLITATKTLLSCSIFFRKIKQSLSLIWNVFDPISATSFTPQRQVSSRFWTCKSFSTKS